MKRFCAYALRMPDRISVLSVEPYGMKPTVDGYIATADCYFSALGRAVWDETEMLNKRCCEWIGISVLSVEPYGMKRRVHDVAVVRAQISVLSVEPYGMKQNPLPPPSGGGGDFSALGRAVWDETWELNPKRLSEKQFQCSRSSRMG